MQTVTVVRYHILSAMTVPAAAAAGTVTPTEVANNVLRCIADSEAAQPPMRFFAFVDEADVRRQAAESTARHDFRSLQVSIETPPHMRNLCLHCVPHFKFWVNVSLRPHQSVIY